MSSIANAASQSGSTDTGTVSLFTGTVSFPVALSTLPGRNGLEYTLSIIYNSGGIPRIVDTWNIDAPTGLLGLGWSLPQNRIVRNTNGIGSTLDNSYYLFSGDQAIPLLKTGADHQGDIYNSEKYQFWKIRYIPLCELWVITKEDGTQYFYGGGVSPGQGGKTGNGNSIEWGVKWGTWIGENSDQTGQEQFPVAWNIAGIENIWGDYISFSYEQDQPFVGAFAPSSLKYTQACRLRQITGATGEKLVLNYGPSGGSDNPYERRQITRRSSSVFFDPYQERLEVHFLERLDVFDRDGQLTSKVCLGYGSLGASQMKKQILKSISFVNEQGKAYIPSQLFEYYGEGGEVSVSETDKSKQFQRSTGALFGALKSVTTPLGSIITYQYQENSIALAQRDLEIIRPTDEWAQPRTFFGGDYVVILWRGTRSQQGKIHISIFQWHGRWIGCEVPETIAVPADAKMADRLQVELSINFFAIVNPGQDDSVHLFNKDLLKPGSWKHSPYSVGRLSTFSLAASLDFLAILDQAAGTLHRFTYDSGHWEQAGIALQKAQDTRFGLVSRGKYFFCVSASPSNTYLPQILLQYLDDRRKWQEIKRSEDHFAPKEGSVNHVFSSESNSGIKQLDLQASDTFVALQVFYTQSSSSGSSQSSMLEYNYDYYIYDWTGNYQLNKRHLLKNVQLSAPDSTLLLRPMGDVRMLVLSDTVYIDVEREKLKYVFKYFGSRWKDKDNVYDNDSWENNFFGQHCFTTTKNGLAKLHQFNFDRDEWQETSIPEYKDGNPTLFEKIWGWVFFFEGIITLPLGPEFLLLDLAVLGADVLISSLHNPGSRLNQIDRYFTGDNSVYYQDAKNQWKFIGKLLEEKEEKVTREISVLPLSRVEDTKELTFQNTQLAQGFIGTCIKHDQVTIDVPINPKESATKTRTRGFPKYISRVQFLKNGGFQGVPIQLPEGESLRRTMDDEANIMGLNSFIAYKGGDSLKNATSLRLYRVINDDIRGPLKDYCVARVTVNDGYSNTHTHYEYDTTTARFLPSGVTALYNKVSVFPAGNDGLRVNGHTESYFYNGSGSPLAHQPAGSTNVMDYPALTAGLLYHTKVIDGQGAEVSTSTQYWQVFDHPLTGYTRGYYIKPIRAESRLDVVQKVTEISYNHRFVIGNHLPDEIVTYNHNATGQPEKKVTSYVYGWERYSELLDRHILTPVVQSSTRVNDVFMGGTNIEWQTASFMPIRSAADGTLPPRLSGVGWRIIEDALVTKFLQSYAPFSSEQRFQESRSFTLMPLSLSSLTSQLRFRYHCAVSNSGYVESFKLQLELWVNGQRIWESSESSSITKEQAVELPLNATLLEWKVTCSALVLKVESTRFHQQIDAQVSISQITFDVLAPATTLQARNAAALSAGAQAGRDWLPISTMVARNPVYGLVTESKNVSGVIHSVIYDKHFRFPVATFDHASVKNGEAGYYGFQDYEDPQFWAISSSKVDATNNRKTVSIEPKRFGPRDPKTCYLVSAWIKPYRMGEGGQIGFGTAAKAITADQDSWHYVELITDQADSTQKPFARCDGEIDHFRFGPVDAPFSATVYDPSRRLVTATVEPNGKITRYLYDDLERLFATIDADEQIMSFRCESHARDNSEQTFKQARPNQSLTITPRTGGRYYQKFPSPDFAENGGVQKDFSQMVTPNYGVRFKVKPLRDALGSPFFGIAFGDAKVVSDDTGLISLYTHKDKLASRFPSSSDFVEWLLVVIDQTAFFFVDGRQVFCQVFSAPVGKPLSVFWGPSESSIVFDDICVLCNPIIGVSYTDGLGRTIQVQHPKPQGTGIIAAQTFYDIWSNPAVQTKPGCIDGGLAYCPDLAIRFDGSSGTMTGKIADYYNRPDIRTPDQTSTDHQYAFTRSVAESSPLARTIEFSVPGSEFRIGSCNTFRTDFHQTPETTLLLADMQLQNLAGHYFSRTTRSPFERDRQVVSAEIFDLQGKLIAQRHGSGGNALTSSYSVTYGANNVQRLAYPPIYFSTSNTPEKNQFIASESTDILGQVIQRADCDRGQQQFIYDGTGRLRFQLDAAGAAETPHRILYWRYDPLGRLIEDGWIHQNWDRNQLQHQADCDASWPTGSAKASTTQALSVWKNRYLYDATPGNASSDADLNYQKLEQLLAAAAQGDANKWSESDQETWKILLKASHREKEGDWLKDGRSSIDVAAINNISNSVLNKIDQLWKRFSNGKFGFHVQKKIWHECNAPEGYSGRQSLGVRVGWYKTDRWIRPGEIQYNLAAPVGHLPASGIYSALSCDDWSVALLGLNALYAHFQEEKDDEGAPSRSQYLQGRLCQMISSNDEGQEIRESYEYDREGRVTAIHLAVEGYDDTVRTTRYHYDNSGNVVKITYPSKIGSGTPFEVYHHYNAMGQLGGVGNADDPTFYAAYDYNIDGSIKTEWLNRRTIQNDHRYDFQGRLVSIVDGSPGQPSCFAEALSYREASGPFKDGNIAQVSLTGSALGIPHRYVYEYDEHGRLLSARGSASTPQTALPGNWDVEGIDGKSIGYDANGNILSFTQCGTGQEYLYETGTNRLVRTESPGQASVFSFEPNELGRFHGGPENPGELKENEWYCKGTDRHEFRLTTEDKHSGTQSLLLGYFLSSRLRVTTRASGYVFKAWIKKPDTGKNVFMSIGAIHGNSHTPLVQQSIQSTGGKWQLFECVLENKDIAPETVLEALLGNEAYLIDLHHPVYVDDVSFDAAEYAYDANGCVIRDRRNRQLQYEPLTGLTREIKADSQRGATKQTRIVKIRYGAQRQRVLKTAISTDSSESTGQTDTTETVRTTLYLHGANAYPLSEESRAGHKTMTVTPSGGSGTGYSEIGSAVYVYGVGGLIAMREGQHTDFFCKDHLGSVRVVLDQDNHVCAGFYYQPFGELIIPNSDSVRRFRYLYTGQEFDWETGLYNYRARMYDPQLGRFCAPDPAHQYASPYEYVGNNPINLIDPTGNAAMPLGMVIKNSLKVFREFHGGELAKNLALGAVFGAASNASAAAMSHQHRNTDLNEIWKEALIGAAAGLVGAGVGFLVDYKIGKGFMSWGHRANIELQEYQVRGWWTLKSFASGAASGLFTQLTANVIDVARGAQVNWTNMAWASGGGLLGGGASGWLGATRMRTGMSWLKATTAKGVTPRKYKIVNDKVDHDIISARGRGWHDYIEETAGQRVGIYVSQISGAAGSVLGAAANEYT
jgi:RHS repeat-associated protein